MQRALAQHAHRRTTPASGAARDTEVVFPRHTRPQRTPPDTPSPPQTHRASGSCSMRCFRCRSSARRCPPSTRPASRPTCPRPAAPPLRCRCPHRGTQPSRRRTVASGRRPSCWRSVRRTRAAPAAASARPVRRRRLDGWLGGQVRGDGTACGVEGACSTIRVGHKATERVAHPQLSGMHPPCRVRRPHSQSLY